MNPPRVLWHATALLALALATGCASVPAGAPVADQIDPWESFNRKVFAFNDAVDTALLVPLATAYRDVLPELVRTGIGNVLGNIRDVWSAANHLLQGKLQTGLEMGMRVATNTVFGLGGLFDPATQAGLTRRPEDFGQTLGRWGVGNGPYLVLPLFGPSTLRDGVGFLVDGKANARLLPIDDLERYAVYSLYFIDLRASLLSTTQLLDTIALDKYSFVRDAYLQLRRDAVYDGAPPMETFDDEPADAAPAATPASKPASAPAQPAPK